MELTPTLSVAPPSGPVSSGGAARDAAPGAWLDLPPERLLDLMLVLPLRCRAHLVELSPSGDDYALTVGRGSATLAHFTVPADAGAAAATRLSQLAGVDPFAAGREGGTDLARVRVEAGDDHGELLVRVRATVDGIEAELRPIAINGAPPVEPMRGVLRRCDRCGAFQPPDATRCEFDQSPLVDVIGDPRPGGTIGVYRVGRTLGEGGMGTVFAADHALLGRPVAIKLLHHSVARQPLMARQFLTEARAASRIDHENVVSIIDFGVADDGRPYLVMERLGGESLRARLDREGTLPPLQAVAIARQLALALEAAHHDRVVHHDLKPSNVVLLGEPTDASPRVKLVDFGACGASGRAPASPDGERIWGTPEYMSPEHVRGDATDGRSDLYSLGLVIHEMISGRSPFAGRPPGEVLLAHLREPPPALADASGLLPEALVQLVARALRKRPEERYQTAREMLLDIDRALHGLGRRGWRRLLPQ